MTENNETEMLRVILCKPGETAEVVEIDDDLESMQELVGGLIQEYMPFHSETDPRYDDVAIICNEEGKLIVDPEREYSPLVKAMGGSFIEISATSPNHINAKDMSRDYGETDPIIEKSQFLQSLCEQIVAGHKFQKGQQSIIDRCTENVYRYYKQGNYMGTPPTLQDFREELLKQPEPEAHSLALELELFTRGSLNTFAKQTNVDTSNRLMDAINAQLAKERLQRKIRCFLSVDL